MNTYKILLVEDEEAILGFTTRKLKRSGYEVFGAMTLSEADKVLISTEVDLIILDVMLPDGNGYDFCKYLRKTHDTPVLFLTGKTQIKDKVEGLNSGCDYYMTKPYDLEELVAIVGTLITRERNQSNKNKLGTLVLNYETLDATINGKSLDLTRKEFALLSVLVDNVNKPMSAETLYEKVWKTPMNESSGALWAQLSRLRKKIESYNMFELVNDRKKGYYLEYLEMI